MKVSAAFPSKWLKSADLRGTRVKVTIDRVDMEDIGGESKSVMYFVGKEKGMILNITNAGRLEMGFGTDEMDDWAGKEIVLYTEPVMFQGKMTQGLRVQVENAQPLASQDEPPF